MKIDRNTLLVIVAAFALGYWVAGPDDTQPRPPSRPVISWISRVAKSLLWVAVLAEGPPAERADSRLVQHAVGADGYPVIDHARGL